jgi:hypothetical protein
MLQRDLPGSGSQASVRGQLLVRVQRIADGRYPARTVDGMLVFVDGPPEGQNDWRTHSAVFGEACEHASPGRLIPADRSGVGGFR